MEVRINKEIRDYTEAVFFGLNIRQLIFSGLACGVAMSIYYVLLQYRLCVLFISPTQVMYISYTGLCPVITER